MEPKCYRRLCGKHSLQQRGSERASGADVDILAIQLNLVPWLRQICGQHLGEKVWECRGIWGWEPIGDTSRTALIAADDNA